MDIASKIQAILFWKAEPISFKTLALCLKLDKEKVIEAINELQKRLENGALTLVIHDEEVVLGISKELSPLIEELTKEEISKDLGKSGLETLSIILYQGPISRSDIDYIRGVNSQFIIRNLLVRGLIERVENPNDARVFLYKPTLSLLSHLGVNKISDLPDYEKVRSEIESFKKTEEQDQS